MTSTRSHKWDDPDKEVNWDEVDLQEFSDFLDDVEFIPSESYVSDGEKWELPISMKDELVSRFGDPGDVIWVEREFIECKCSAAADSSWPEKAGAALPLEANHPIESAEIEGEDINPKQGMILKKLDPQLAKDDKAQTRSVDVIRSV